MNEKTSRTTWKIRVVVIFLFAAGLLLRLYDVTDEPLETHPTRQLRSAIIARGIYYKDNLDVPSEAREFAANQLEIVGMIEPSILEFLSVQVYKLAGEELVWAGRLFSIAFWMLGGLALYHLAAQIGSKIAAVISLGYYLFLPFGLVLSRVTMPDPMMVSGTVIAVWALFNWEKKREIKWALLTGVVTGFAILTKTVAGIILLFPFAFFLLSTNSLKSLLKNKQVWVILLLSALPTAVYYFYGIFIDEGLASQFGGRFFPNLWTDLVFYKTWGVWIIKEFNILAFLGGLAGIFLARSKPVRWLLFGWWAGVFVYGMTFTYHTMTHNYYHLPLVPVAAISLSPTITAAINQARGKDFAKLAHWIGIVVLVVFLGFSTYEYIAFVSEVDYRQQKAAYQEIGDIIAAAPPGKRIALTPDYETSLRFYAMLKADHWPGTGDLVFKEQQTGKHQTFEKTWALTEGCTYFLVTDFKDLDRQPELQEKLSTYPIYAEGEGYVIYHIGARE